MNIKELARIIEKDIIKSRYQKKFWIYKNFGIVIDLLIDTNNIVLSIVPNFKENKVQVRLYSKNIPDSLSMFEDSVIYKNNEGKYIIFEDSLEKIDLAIHTINKYIYEVEKELIYNKPKTYDGILVKPKKGATSTILAFSSVGTKRGTFTFYKTFENIEANVIFVNDYKSHWYTNGTPDFSSEYEFEKYIKDKLAELDTKKLFAFGSSMGGYAAMKYGSIFEADGIISMCPEVELSMPFSKSISKIPTLKGAGDLSRLKFKNPKKVYLFSGNDDFVDYYSSIKLKEKNPDLSLTILNNMPHVIAATIHEKVDLSILAKNLFFDNNETLLSQIGHNKIVDYQVAQEIRLFIEKVRLEKITDLSYKKSLIKTALDFPEWALVQYYSYLIFKAEKDVVKQEEYLLKTLQAKKKHTTARLDLAKLYFTQGELYKALDHLLILKEHKFSFSCGELLYKTLVKLEKIDEAKNVLKEMNKLELNDKQKKLLDSYLHV